MHQVRWADLSLLARAARARSHALLAARSMHRCGKPFIRLLLAAAAASHHPGELGCLAQTGRRSRLAEPPPAREGGRHFLLGILAWWDYQMLRGARCATAPHPPAIRC